MATENNTAPVLKTYMLLEATRPSAPISMFVSPTEKVKLNKLSHHAAFLQSTFTDENGNNRTARLKLNSNSIWQDEQIAAGIPANLKPTNAERAAVAFRYEMLITNNKIVQQYLEAIPQYDGFKGFAPDGEQKLYKLYDKGVEIKSANSEFKRRLEAANKINDLDLEQAQELLIRVNGSYFTPPDNLEECQNALVEYIEDIEGGVEEVLKAETQVTQDDAVTVLLGRLLAAEKISFDAVPNHVAIKRGDSYTNLKMISDEHEPDEKLRQFTQFLNSDEGAPLRKDLEGEVKKLKPKKS